MGRLAIFLLFLVRLVPLVPLAPLAATVTFALGCSSPPYATGACGREESAQQACPGSAVVRGIDVSAYQGSISWDRAKDAGVAFAFARISDGVEALDQDFASNWGAMGRAGVVRGSYQFFRAGQDASAQASLVVTALADAGGLRLGDLPVVMDIETADGQSSAIVQARMSEWLDAVAGGTGKSPIVYTNAGTSPVIGPGFGRYALWVANWGVSCPVLPAGWSAWRFWQYSATGMIDGVEGAVDLDEFDGTLSELLTFAGQGSGADGGSDAAGEGGDAEASGEEASRGGQPCAP